MHKFFQHCSRACCPIELVLRRLVCCRLLVVGILFDPRSGLVTLNGSGGPDTARIRLQSDQVVVELQTTEGAFLRSFDRSAVEEIEFNGHDGDDTCVNDTHIDSTQNGGPGDDTLVGGGGSDKLVGGPGHDRLFGRCGDDSLHGHDGNDRLRGGAGDDHLDGGDGDDDLHGGPGSNTLVDHELPKAATVRLATQP